MSKLGGTFTFPSTNVTVNRMGYGAMQLAGPGVFGPPKDRAACIAVLRAAIAAGVDHIDTSDFYGPHVTNQIIHEALHPYPANLTLVTKVGGRRGGTGAWFPAQKPAELISAVHDNLRNLGLDALDIVNMRFWGDGHGPADGPVEEQLSTLAKLQQEGLIRHIGVSNVTASQVDEACGIVSVVCVQNLYNVALRKDDELIDSLDAQGIAYVPFFPLGGFSPLQSGTLNEIAATLDTTPMQVALAWLLHRSPNILLIPGTSSVAHLNENLAASNLQLPADALTHLDAIAAAEPWTPPIPRR
jgi:aryl-alcohol dehydrogenase-like predicted oxidoreductase